MATGRQKQSYQRLRRNKVQRFKGNSKARDICALVIGPISKFDMPDGSVKNRWVGDYGLYLVVTYKKSKGQWIFGKFFNAVSNLRADKLIRTVRKTAKTVYYTQNQAALRTHGKLIRRDCELRPPRK